MAAILFKVIQGQLSYEESFAIVRNENTSRLLIGRQMNPNTRENPFETTPFVLSFLSSQKSRHD